MIGRALDRRVAIITGAASGLGKEYALQFATAGARLVLADLPTSDLGPDPESPLERLRERITADGGQAVVHYGDIGAETTSEELVTLALDTFGSLDVLVNNAGNWHEGALIDADVREWDTVLRTHLRAPFLTTRAAGRHWRTTHRSGQPVAAAIINTSSRSALNAIPTHGVYAAAKAGTVTLTQIAAKELQPFGVRVNCVVPAARTPMATRVTAMKPQLDAPVTKDQFDHLAPANVAPLVAYLSTRECPLTGQVLFCRGGTIEAYAPWKSTSTLEKDGRWSVAELAERLPSHLANSE